MQSIMDTEKTRCLIIGSGPAGYTAAIYASRANLNPILYEGTEPGGQLTSTTDIENFPGYPEGISGTAMMEDLKKQAQRFGADVRFGIITGMGVSGCATCDGFFYRKKDVIVVGGGDTACEEATYLATLCNKVYMVVRKDYLRASKAMQERVMKTPNIEVLFGYTTVEVLGDENGVTGALVRHTGGEEKVIDAFGFFLGIGHHPNTQLFEGQLELDKEGYIKTVPGSSQTSVKGVFAAGDVQDPRYRQAITAAGSGCMAALDCERYLLDIQCLQ